jgi:hypothetical protein
VLKVAVCPSFIWDAGFLKVNVASVGTYTYICHWVSNDSYYSGRTPRFFITVRKPSTGQDTQSFNAPAAKYTVLRSLFVLCVTCLTSRPECVRANAGHACTGFYVRVLFINIAMPDITICFMKMDFRGNSPVEPCSVDCTEITSQSQPNTNAVVYNFKCSIVY